MKKAFVLAVTALFVIGFAASAFAIHKETPVETSAVVVKGEGTVLTLDGSLRFRGYTQADTVKGNTSEDKNGYDTRIRLGTKAEVGPVTGYVQLETGFGSSDVVTWSEGSSAGLKSGGDKDIDALSVLQAWVQYTFGNAGVKVGHMPLALGHKLFFDHTGSGDNAIVAFYNPTAQTHIAALIIKFEEGTVQNAGDDIDGYVLLGTHKLSDMVNLGANLTHLRAIDSPVATLDGRNFSLWNVGLTADGKITDMLSYKADFEFQTGTLFENDSLAGDLDHSAWALMANVTADLGAAKAGLEVGYGKGQDPDEADSENFINFLTDTRYFSTIVGYRLQVPGQDSKNTGVANILYVQGMGSMKTVCPLTKKDLSLKARINYMMLNEDVVIIKPSGPSEESDLGFEIEAFATWDLSKGLKYFIEAAYLVAGDAWGNDPENPYFVRHGIQMAF